jgi:DNA-binding winged helix-turn-helix (wHTH) protein
MEEHSGADIVLFGGFRFDRRRGVLSRQNEDGEIVPVPIGWRALDILGLLIDRHGDLVSRDEIMSTVWPGVVEGANVTVQISALRRTLDDGRSDGSVIQTIPGRGGDPMRGRPARDSRWQSGGSPPRIHSQSPPLGPAAARNGG